MPVSIVVGGQFGSEGKGKVALELVRRDPNVAAVVRVGGTNSGHTGIGLDNRRYALRQLPAASIDRKVHVVLPAGSYIDVEILKKELRLLSLGPDNVSISPLARIIGREHKDWESSSNLGQQIGSTQSGTGAAVLAAVARGALTLDLPNVQACEVAELSPYLRDTNKVLRGLLDSGRRVVIEGTQGFGLSLLHGGHWPKATGRDTTAAAFLSEAGLGPFDVDDVTLVIRCHPIRVAGDSGPLSQETTWCDVAKIAGLPADYIERTTATGKIRRVGNFEPEVVKRAISHNRPNRIVLNHLDYVDGAAKDGHLTSKAKDFVELVEFQISRPIDWLGLGSAHIVERNIWMPRNAHQSVISGTETA